MLKLNKWFIEEINLHAQMDDLQKLPAGKLEALNGIRPFFFSSRQNDDNYKITLETVVEIKASKFMLKMKTSGIFTIKDEDDMDRAIIHTAPALLMVAARSAGESILKNTVYPNVEMPYFDFIPKK
ncbi:MAG: protein-export chaperone SecB [Proteobacteria bacterium]|nr:protein-export chaperone SecB [Pseudomonadota bacterium]